MKTKLKTLAAFISGLYCPRLLLAGLRKTISVQCQSNYVGRLK